MKNNVISLLMSFVFIFVTVFATENTVWTKASDSIDVNDIISALESSTTPFFGELPMDFDLTGDDVIDVFDLGLLKQKLIAGEPGITPATVHKLENWILARPDSTLTLEYLSPVEIYTPSEKMTSYLKNVTSNDFRIIAVDASIEKNAQKLKKPVAYIYFLGIDEYVCEIIRISNFCQKAKDLDECIVNSNVCIGIKDNVYTLALNNNTEDYFEYTQFYSDNPNSSEDIGPAYIMYDLTNLDLYENHISNLIYKLQTEFSNNYEYEFQKDNQNKVIALCKKDNSVLELIVYEKLPIQEIGIYENDEFYLFYSDANGFGIQFK